MNILQLEDTIKGLPDEALMQEAQQPSGQVPQFLVISEVQRRSDMRKRHQQQSQEQPQGTVADQVLQEGIAGMAPPSPGMQQAMGGPPTQMMYGGGVVRMQNMGQVPFYPDLASRGFGPSVGEMQQKINMLLESGVSTEDIISIIGEDDYKRAGFRMPTTQAAGLDLSGMNVPVGEDLVADLDQLSRTSRLMDDIATEPDVIPSADFVGSAAQISEQPGNRYSPEFTDVLDEIRMGRTPSEKEFPYPSLGDLYATVDPPRQEAKVPGVREGRVTVEEIFDEIARGPERQNPYSEVGSQEELLAKITGDAGKRVTNAIKEDADKATALKVEVSGQEKTAMTKPEVDLPAVINPEDISTKTGIMDSLSRYYRPGANIQQEVARREKAPVEQDSPGFIDSLSEGISSAWDKAKEYDAASRQGKPDPLWTWDWDQIKNFRGIGRPAYANPFEPSSDQTALSSGKLSDPTVPGSDAHKYEYLAGLGGGKPPLTPEEEIVGPGSDQPGGGDGVGLAGGDVSTPQGVLAEMSRLRGEVSNIPKTDYSDLIAASEARQKESTSKMQRLAEGLAIAQLGAGIAKGDLSSGISKAAEIAGKTKKENLAFRRQEEQVRDAYKLKMAEADSLAKKAELKAELDILTQMASVLKTIAISDNERTRLWNTVLRDSSLVRRTMISMQKNPAYEGMSEPELIKMIVNQMMGETSAPGTSADYSGFSLVSP